MGYSSGYLARELGLGQEGYLPGRADPVVLHGPQSDAALGAMIDGPVTPEVRAAADAIANLEKNKNLDTYTKQTLAAGAEYGRQQQGQLNRRRMSGAALAGAGGAAGLIALIQLLQSPKMESMDDQRR